SFVRARIPTGSGRSSSCSFPPLVFSSRDCFSIGPLPPCPPFACGGCGVLACPHTPAVHVQRSSRAVHDLLRDRALLDALELVRARAVLEAVLTRAGLLPSGRDFFSRRLVDPMINAQ